MAAPAAPAPDLSTLQAAWEQGFQKGKCKGFEKGLEKGKNNGFDKGHEKGKNKGYTKGFQKGKALDWNQLCDQQ